MNATIDDGQSWRQEMIRAIEEGTLVDATDALLSLTFHEPDRVWLEELLATLLDPKYDRQIRELAVVCAGHVARIHRSIGADTIALLNLLADDPELGGVAATALDDIHVYVPQEPTDH